MAQPFNHLELRSPDVKKAETFYSSLFGWKLNPMPEMHYTLFSAGDGPGGGMMQAEADGTPHWVPYVKVTNIEAVVAKAQQMGATVRMGVTEIPMAGKIAVLGDPAGSPIGLNELPKPAKQAAARKPAAKKSARKPAKKARKKARRR